MLFVAFYLFDCFVLLLPTQALIDFKRPNCQGISYWISKIGRTRAHSGASKASQFPRGQIALNFGLTSYFLRGRFPALLNPLTPYNLVFIDVSSKPPAG